MADWRLVAVVSAGENADVWRRDVAPLHVPSDCLRNLAQGSCETAVGEINIFHQPQELLFP